MLLIWDGQVCLGSVVWPGLAWADETVTIIKKARNAVKTMVLELKCHVYCRNHCFDCVSLIINDFNCLFHCFDCFCWFLLIWDGQVCLGSVVWPGLTLLWPSGTEPKHPWPSGAIGL